MEDAGFPYVALPPTPHAREQTLGLASTQDSVLFCSSPGSRRRLPASWGLCEGGSPSQGCSPSQAPQFLPQFSTGAESTGKEVWEGARWPEQRVPDLPLSWEAGPIQRFGRPWLWPLTSQPSTSLGLVPDLGSDLLPRVTPCLYPLESPTCFSSDPGPWPVDSALTACMNRASAGTRPPLLRAKVSSVPAQLFWPCQPFCWREESRPQTRTLRCEHGLLHHHRNWASVFSSAEWAQ